MRRRAAYKQVAFAGVHDTDGAIAAERLVNVRHGVPQKEQINGESRSLMIPLRLRMSARHSMDCRRAYGLSARRRGLPGVISNLGVQPAMTPAWGIGS